MPPAAPQVTTTSSALTATPCSAAMISAKRWRTWGYPALGM
jgi:hypothetical protein